MIGDYNDEVNHQSRWHSSGNGQNSG